MINSTIAGNTAHVEGGGVYAADNGADFLDIVFQVVRGRCGRQGHSVDTPSDVLHRETSESAGPQRTPPDDHAARPGSQSMRVSQP